MDSASIQSRIQNLDAKLHYTIKWLSTVNRGPLTISPQQIVVMETNRNHTTIVCGR